MTESQRNTVVPYLAYEDGAAAISWLCDVFGFTEALRMGDGGRVSHAELHMGSGEVYLGEPGGEFKSPKSGGYPESLVCVEIDDVDAHYQRAKAAGSEIVEEPRDEPYGYRRYAVLDPEGHRWFFMQHLRDVPPEEWGAQRAG